MTKMVAGVSYDTSYSKVWPTRGRLLLSTISGTLFLKTCWFEKIHVDMMA